MRQQQKSIEVATRGPGLHEISDALGAFVADAGIETGLVTAFCRHTSCSLLLQENADPDVRTDLDGFFKRIVPEGMDWIVHTHRGARRHAGPHPDGADAELDLDPGRGRRAAAWHLAGSLPLRAPGAAASAEPWCFTSSGIERRPGRSGSRARREVRRGSVECPRSPRR